MGHDHSQTHIQQINEKNDVPVTCIIETLFAMTAVSPMTTPVAWSRRMPSPICAAVDNIGNTMIEIHSTQDILFIGLHRSNVIKPKTVNWKHYLIAKHNVRLKTELPGWMSTPKTCN